MSNTGDARSSSRSHDQAGVYRLGSIFTVYPNASGDVPENVLAHEYAHALLGNSTLAGMLHQAIRYLSVSGVPGWNHVLVEGARLARSAHEATATASSLLADGEINPERLRLLPASYRAWVAPTLAVVEQLDARRHTKRVVVHALAAYAMDDPLKLLLRTPGGLNIDLLDDLGWLPRIDDRYALVLDAVALNLDALVPTIDAADAALATSDTWVSGTYREFLTERRRRTYGVSVALRSTLRELFGDSIPAIDGTPPNLRASWVQIESHLRALVGGSHGPLADWHVSFDDDVDGPDPLLFRQSIPYPNVPLSGIVPISDTSQLPGVPDATVIHKINCETWLTSERQLMPGQYYARYYYAHPERGGFAAVFNIIDDSVGAIMGDLAGRCPFLVHGFDLDVERPSLGEGLEGATVGFWRTTLSDDLFQELIRRGNWHIAFLTWPAGTAVTAVFSHVTLPLALLMNVAGAPLLLMADDADRASLKHATSPWAIDIANALETTFPYSLPSEGVPVSQSVLP